jgi:CRISPR-associated protein Csb2
MSQGQPEWPPSPARLYQALVAGLARGNALPDDMLPALRWLESLEPPLIVAPRAMDGQRFPLFVPNNDADTVKDPRDLSGIRVSKVLSPRLFDADEPILYVWMVPDDASQAETIVEAADHLYQLGRGVDMAWAMGHLVDEAGIEKLRARHSGIVYAPSSRSRSGMVLLCPTRGTLESLIRRHSAAKLKREGSGKRARVLFVNPPKPRLAGVYYGASSTWLPFELRNIARAGSPFAPWPLKRAADLVQQIRGAVDDAGVPTSGAAGRLWEGLPDSREEIPRILIGRDATEADKAARIRIVPLPSIGHVYASPSIRRVLVEIPPACPLNGEDLAWAFSGLEIGPRVVDSETGEVQRLVQLVPARDRSFLRHYGLAGDQGFRIWRTVTPVVLPRTSEKSRRGTRRSGTERQEQHDRASVAVLNALRHAGIRNRVFSVRAQREPFDPRGTRAEAFAEGTRFVQDRLWHVEIQFAEPVVGPLVLGDGRYLGLGLMRPVDGLKGMYSFQIVSGLEDSSEPVTASGALRRALMARVQRVLGKRNALPTFFTGHQIDGSPARGSGHEHLFFATDFARQRLLVVAPHVVEHRKPAQDERRHLDTLSAALEGFQELRAGMAGKLRLAPGWLTDHDPLLGPSAFWISATEYRVTRHWKKKDARTALIDDVRSELLRRNLPDPVRIEVQKLKEGPRGGISGWLQIEFSIAVNGPILVGKTAHLGGGLFESVSCWNS